MKLLLDLALVLGSSLRNLGGLGRFCGKGCGPNTLTAEAQRTLGLTERV